MAWTPYFRGDGTVRAAQLGPPPPWADFPRRRPGLPFHPPEGLADAASAALRLRRPLAITGPPGSGRSAAAAWAALHLGLGPVLSWRVTPRSTLAGALYRYDAAGHAADRQLRGDGTGDDGAGPYLELGPAGAALASTERPRALLADDLDDGRPGLPDGLLGLLDREWFEIPELARSPRPVSVRLPGTGETCPVAAGRVRCARPALTVVTARHDGALPAGFLGRCVRYRVPVPGADALMGVIGAHLGRPAPASGAVADLAASFAARLRAGEQLGIDQFLNAAFVLTGPHVPGAADRDLVIGPLLQELPGP